MIYIKQTRFKAVYYTTDVALATHTSFQQTQLTHRATMTSY